MQQTGSAAPHERDGTKGPNPSPSLTSQAAARHRRERGQILVSLTEELDHLVDFVRQDSGCGPVLAEYQVTQFVRGMLGIPGEGTWVDADELRHCYLRAQSQSPMKRLVTDMLLQDGVKPHLSGYPLLRDAVLAVAADRSTLRDMMQLYAKVGLQHSTTATRAERSMRHALASVEVRGRRPTVSQYVALLADRLIGGV